MANRFSSNLIRETIAVFKEEDGLVISAETANEYLEALSGFFLAFAGAGVADGLQAGATDRTDLISPHSCNKG